MHILSRIFHQILSFSGEIIAYQEFFLLTSSAKPQQQRKRENKQNKTDHAAHCLAGFFSVIA